MLYEKLAKIQRELKAPKSQFNSFGKYNYRNCEDILEAVKPMLDGLVLTLSDEVVQIGDRYYVKATAKLTGDLTGGISNCTNIAFAREEENRKGMDAAQLTGATSSYARKYALAGLFLLDDCKDSDATNQHDKAPKSDKEVVNEYAAESQKVFNEKLSADEMRGEMTEWFVEKYGADAMLKFSEMTNGAFSDPAKIKLPKNVVLAYQKFQEYKEGK